MSTGSNAILFYGFIEPEAWAWGYIYDEFLHNDGRKYAQYPIIAGSFDWRNDGTVSMISNPEKKYSHYIAHKDAHYKTLDGSLVAVGTTLETHPQWDEDIRHFASAIGVDLGDQKAQWYLAAYWG